MNRVEWTDLFVENLLQPNFLIPASFLILVVAVLFDVAVRHRAKRDRETQVSNQRTSVLAFFAFGFGLLTALTVLGSIILVWLGDHAEVVDIHLHDARYLYLSARIVALCSLAPALGAVAFWLAARGVITESEGALRGRALYRTGMLMTALALAGAFAGRSSVHHVAQDRLEAVRAEAKRELSGFPVKDTPAITKSKIEECGHYLDYIVERLRSYESDVQGFPEVGGENLYHAMNHKLGYSERYAVQYTNGSYLADPWGGRIEWIENGEGEYLLYSFGPDGVNDSGKNDDIFRKIRKTE